MMQSPIGESLVIAPPGCGAFHFLNASAAELWGLYRESEGEASLVDQLVRRYRFAEEDARAQIDALVAQWRQAGLIHPPPPASAAPVEDWVIAPPPPSPLEPGETAMRMAGIAMALRIDDPDLSRCVTQAAPLRIDPTIAAVSHRLRLTGEARQWTLGINGKVTGAGATADDAAIGVISALIDLACRAEERLLVVHGAGLVTPDGGGLLLAAPGGSGKTTLAAALNAEGWPLLSDDVVPVDSAGRLLAIGASICLKSGSWPVLASRRPDVAQSSVLHRFGERVRLIAPVGETPQRPVIPRLILFPRYDAGSQPSRRRLSAEAALQGLIEAESIIKDLTQKKLDTLTRWIGSLEAFELSYPNLDTGLALVRQCVSLAAGGGDPAR